MFHALRHVLYITESRLPTRISFDVNTLRVTATTTWTLAASSAGTTSTTKTKMAAATTSVHYGEQPSDVNNGAIEKPAFVCNRCSFVLVRTVHCNIKCVVLCNAHTHTHRHTHKSFFFFAHACKHGRYRTHPKC